ncbi:MAG: ABC transporter ATP-binding protein [Betaproteobacteria bacterium]|nr:ABC transporter ATP-binding protein [Betaproteobacteria bacterium]
MSILRTVDLTRSFGSLLATDSVSLDIQAGERHAIIGPNGAGKSSLLHQLGGQLRPSSGRIYFKESDITGLGPERICRLGISRTFQTSNLFSRLSVLENVRLAVLSRRGNPLAPFVPLARLGAIEARSLEILEMVGLAGRKADPVRNLSYGEQRQLEIAIALATEPELLLLDEPTAGMSPAETARMIEFVARLPRTLTVLMIEHDMQVVFSLADRITVLHYGRLLATGTPGEITANKDVQDIYLGSAH